MMNSITFLPHRGRGTMRSMVEGHAQNGATLAGCEARLVPLHHLRWFPSPCRGGIA